MMGSPVEYFQNAMTEIGEIPLQSMDGPEPAAVVAKVAYERIVRTRLCAHKWSFARLFQTLVASPTAAPAPWLYSWAKPKYTILLIHNLTVGGFDIVYDIDESLIYTYDRDPPVMDATRRSAEAEWSALFDRCIIMDLAATLRRGVKRDFDGATALANEAELAFRKALVADKRQKPGKRPNRPRLVQVHLGRAGTTPLRPSDI